MRTTKKAILGIKLGMTRIFDTTGKAVPVTVVQCGPCPVVQVRTDDVDGYSAVQIGFVDAKEKHISKPVQGHFKKAGVDLKRHLKEFRNYEKELKVGDVITVEDFVAGDLVRVSGTSKGHGFQGVVKRHHFRGVGMQTHGQSDRQRHPGSVGGSSDPSRVFKGLRMAGQMGNKRATLRNLEVVEVIADKNLLLIKGGLPGAENTILEIDIVGGN
ncbi:MAG: 50S ribosomal protein L3 [Ignavibacteria bacterium]|nr:50S ribosomal protein L3 [Ignavibacteria bacterium]